MSERRELHIGIDATVWWNDRGFGRFTRSLVSELLKRHGDIRYTLVVDRPDQGILPAGARVVAAHSSRPITASAVQSGSRSFRDVLLISRLVSQERFDAFFFPAVYSFFPLLTRTPCVVTFHDAIAERFPDLTFPTERNRRLWNLKTSLAKRQATRAMTVSEASAQDLESILRIPRQRIDVVTEGPDPVFRPPGDPELATEARRRLGIPLDVPCLIYVGGINPHKNVLGLVRAMPMVVERHPNVHLAVVGDISKLGFHDNVDQLVGFVRGHEQLPKHVTFTGRLTDDELVHLLWSAAALVFPSLWEGFGLPAAEAMACRVPVLASRRGNLPELVGPGGLLFDPTDPRDIARTISLILENPSLREELAAHALEHVKRFTWERGAELAEACFRRAVQ